MTDYSPHPCITVHDSMQTLSLPHLKKSLEQSAGNNLRPGFFKRLKPEIYRVYIWGAYQGGIIILTSPHGPYVAHLWGPPTRDQKDITAALWDHAVENHPAFYWVTETGHEDAGFYKSQATLGWLECHQPQYPARHPSFVYYRGDPLLSHGEGADLIVEGAHWALRRMPNFEADT